MPFWSHCVKKPAISVLAHQYAICPLQTGLPPDSKSKHRNSTSSLTHPCWLKHHQDKKIFLCGKYENQIQFKAGTLNGKGAACYTRANESGYFGYWSFTCPKRGQQAKKIKDHNLISQLKSLWNCPAHFSKKSRSTYNFSYWVWQRSLNFWGGCWKFWILELNLPKKRAASQKRSKITIWFLNSILCGIVLHAFWKRVEAYVTLTVGFDQKLELLDPRASTSKIGKIIWGLDHEFYSKPWHTVLAAKIWISVERFFSLWMLPRPWSMFKKSFTKCKFDKIDLIQYVLYIIRVIHCRSKIVL